jgi:hypothetical protein
VKLSDLQRQTLVRVIRATARGQWCRALGSGERVTLASLHAKGLLVRQVWKESKSAAARGHYSSPAHEYQATALVMQAATEMYPEALASAR